MSHIVVILLFLIIGVPKTCFSQVSAVYGSLRVSVVDSTGAQVPSASITVRMPERNWARTASVTGESTYFPALAPGDYTVAVTAEGFDAQQSVVKVLLGHEAALRFVLRPGTHREEITVAAAASAVDSYTIPVHTHVSQAEIHGLPINQRSFLDFALLDSGLQRDTLRVHAVAVTSGFNVMGQRPRTNSLQLDGADLNDETTGGVRGSVPMEAVQEFQVLTSGYQAEYGRASGGVVNVVTKTGSNSFHGTLFGFLRHRSLDATNPFSAVKNPPYTRTQYGASLGGRLRKDRTFFFVSFEQLRRQESGFSRIGVNAAALGLTPQQQALAASQPAHPAVRAAVRGSAIARTGIDPDSNAAPSHRMTPLLGLGGIYPISQRTGSYMARFDHEISRAHRLSARLNYAHDRLSSFEAQNNDQISGLLAFERTAALTTLDPTAVLTLSSVLSPRALNDLRFSWGQRKFDMTPNGLGAPVNIPGIAFLGRENILPHYRKEKHVHFDDAVTLSIGAHTLKAGGDLMLCPTTVEYHRLTNGLFTFGPQAAPGAPADSPQLTAVQTYGLGLASNFVQQFGDPVADAGKMSAGVFAQDSWRVSPRLTLDLGLRYDVERTDTLNPGSPAMQQVFDRLALRRSPPVDANNFQPRVGFAYQAMADGRLTLRGSYGLYYDRLLNLATYLSAAGDGAQMTRVILPGAAAATVFQSPTQKLPAYPGGDPPTGLIAFSKGWELGNTQQANLMLSSQVRPGLTLDAGYVWVKGTHLPRSRDFNPPDSAQAAAFLAAGNTQAALLRLNFLRPVSQVSETMAFEGSASSVYHGLRLSLRGRVTSALTLNGSYAFSKAIDDAEEIFPHTRAQDMRDFQAERGLALYDQRHRFVFAGIYQMRRSGAKSSAFSRLLNDWSVAPYLELGSGRPVNVLLGADNNLDQEPGSDRPNVVPAGTSNSYATRYGSFAVPASGVAGNLGRNAFLGPGYASFNLRLQRDLRVRGALDCQFIAESFNLFNRMNVRSVNPNYQRAGEPLSAFDPRQIQLGVRLRF
jgi:outer membrane receptor protein involved in Fe transport